MKKVFVAVFGLLLATPSLATLPVPSVLEFREVPAFGEQHSSRIPQQGKLHSVSVYANGSAVASEKIGTQSRIVKVSQLTVEQMDRITSIVRDARDGEVKQVHPGIACFVASPILNSYTAEHGRVMLYYGHPCNGALTVNQSAAAAQLIEILRKLTSEAFSRTVIAQ